MYNQVNRGPPHLGQGTGPQRSLRPRSPIPAGYQQALPPPPPPHYQHFVPPPNVGGPPAPRVYLPGPPSTSSTVPLNVPIQGSVNVMPNTGPSYAIPPRMHHGSGMAQQTSWAPGPPNRVLPPPPPPPPSSSQGQVLYNPLPPPPPPPLLCAPGPDGAYHHSNFGNYQVPCVAPPPPPLPTSPPPVLPSPPPPNPPMTSASAQASCFDDPSSMKFSGFESSKGVNSVDGVLTSCSSGVVSAHNFNSDANQDGESCGEATVAYRDERLDLPPPPPRPADKETMQKIEALCQRIAENGGDIEEKVRQDEYNNPEHAFLIGGNPGTEAAISHAYFLWMKKKCNMEPRRHEKKSESQLKSLAVDSSKKQYHQHDATTSADSDMEMEDDITLSNKDQGSSSYAIEVVTQQHDQVDVVFNMNRNMQQLQNSTESDPDNTILSSAVSCSRSVGVSKPSEGLGLLSYVEHTKSASSVIKVHSPSNDSPEVAETLLDTVLERMATPVNEDHARNDTSDHNEATNARNDTSDHNEATYPLGDSGQLMQSGSPIRLLQEYASDETSQSDNENCAADANSFPISAGAHSGVSAAHKDSESHLETDIESKSPSSTQKGLLFSKSSQNDSEISPHLVQESEGTCKRSESHTSDGCVERNLENQLSANFASSVEAFQGKDGIGGPGSHHNSKSGNAEQEDERRTPKFEPTVLKVDEFGRHLREGATDSESDDSRSHRTRRINKRDRSRSRSRSPLDRRSRRRRRSPRWRKDKRSQSRSWSPRHRRSRSRSPILRRSSDVHGEVVKREKGQCFDFLRGKCYRGASCRYLHQESDKNAASRRSRNKHAQEIYSREKSSRINEGIKNVSSKVSDYEHGGVRDRDVDVTGQEVVQSKEDSERHDVVSTTFGLDGQLANINPSSEGFKEVTAKVQETLVVREEPKTIIHENDTFQKAQNSNQHDLVGGLHHEALSSGGASKLFGNTSKDVILSEDGSFVQQLQSNVIVGDPEHSCAPQLLNVSCVTDLSSDKRSAISAEVSGCESLPYMLPSTQLESATSTVAPSVPSEQPSLHTQASKELPSHSGTLVGLPLHTHPLPASVGLHSQGQNTVHMPQMPGQYIAMQQNAFLPFPAPLPTPNSHFSVPPNIPWTSLPPPPPSSQEVYNSNSNFGVAKSFISSEFNQSQLHSRTDPVSQTSMNPGLPAHSQSSKFEDQGYPPMQDCSRTTMLTEPFSPKHLHQGNPESQSLSRPNLTKEDNYNQLSMLDSKFSSSTSFGGLHHQPKQFSRESDVNLPQPSLVGKFPPEGHFRTSSHIYSLSQQQQSVYSFQYSSDVNLGVPGGTATVPRNPPDVHDSNHSTSLPAFVGSGISARYNPYASTFEQPLSSKFSSNFLRQDDIMQSNNYGSSRLNYIIDREGVGAGSIQTAPSLKPARAVGQNLTRPGGEQYDPLFDSIEPSSSLKKFDFDQNQEVTGESNISLRPKSSNMSLDVKEKKHEEVGAGSSTSSQYNDEYGETADAEVSNDVNVANMTPGEVEINQIKSPGKRKKSKDSRSMKLFKISIANFVKEVLKPSWRQGNMSKVAFKTIVKKTVDKVSGAMKGHRIPKSQAKISQYIDSSQRKLTKLVMGYVDKYVKV